MPSNPSTIWTQLSTPASPVGSLPFVASDGLTLTTDVLNYFYTAASTTLFARNLSAGAGASVANTVFAPDGYIQTNRQVYANGAGIQTPASLVETSLFQYSIPANIWSGAIVGQGFEFEFIGTCGADANNKTLSLYFGNALGGVKAFTSTFALNAGTWKIRGKVMHIAANSQMLQCELMSTLGIVMSGTGVNTMFQSANEANAINLQLSGTNGTAVAGDIILQAASIKWME